MVAKKVRGSESPFVAHFWAVEEVEAHVVVMQLGTLPGKLLCEVDFAQGRVGAEREEGKVGVVEEVLGRQAARQNVHNADSHNAAIDAILLVVGAERDLFQKGKYKNGLKFT